jgi:hypothetical protein
VDELELLVQAFFVDFGSVYLGWYWRWFDFDLKKGSMGHLKVLNCLVGVRFHLLLLLLLLVYRRLLGIENTSLQFGIFLAFPDSVESAMTL